MANALLLQQIANGGLPPGTPNDTALRARMAGQQMDAQRQQMQQNALNQQYVAQDRQRDDQTRQKAQLDSDVMNAYAPVALQKDEAVAAQLWAQGAAQLKQKYPGLQIPDQYPGRQAAFEMASPHMPPELRNEMLKQEFAPKKVEPPNSAQEYQFAQQQGYKGSYMDWMRERATQVAQFKVDNPTAAPDKPPAGYRFTKDGNLEQIPGGPADEKGKARAAGGDSVDTLAATLNDYYNQLEKGGGITNPNNGALSNIGAGLSSSGVGQAVGRLLGTSNQSARNSIAQTRPLLLQAIKNATGMSAKQMDSNAELKMYLAAATDPQLDVSANRAALANIVRLYGSGNAAPAQPPSAPQQGGGPVTVSTPDGHTFQFPSQQAADAWKAKNGL